MILDEIAERTKERIAKEKESLPFEELRRMAEVLPVKENRPFYEALKKPGISFICEAKKASPSKGIIAEDFPYLDIALSYEEAGASAISCLTEPFFFKGSDAYLRDITAAVTIPVLRKDFTVDPYMIFQAKRDGASAVLLICAILDPSELAEYAAIAESLGLSALVETHDEKEIDMALNAGSKIIGVNNRNLKDFTVDINNSARLRGLVPTEVAFVSESGIKTKEDVRKLVENGTDAVLVGETLMRSADKRAALNALRPVV